MPLSTQNLKDINEPDFLYYPVHKYPGKHEDSQFCPFLDYFSKSQNEAILVVKSGWTLKQAHLVKYL